MESKNDYRHHGWQNYRRSAVDEVTNRLDNCRYLLVPERAVGCVSPCYNGKGELNPDVVRLTITDVSRLIYLEGIEVIGNKVDYGK